MFLDSLVSEQQKREQKRNINEIYRVQTVNSEGEPISVVMLRAFRKGILDPITVPLSITHIVDVGTRDDVALFFAEEYAKADKAEQIGTYISDSDGYHPSFGNRLIAVGLGTRSAYLAKGIDYKRRLFDMRFGSAALPDIVRFDRTELMALELSETPKETPKETTKATPKAKTAKTTPKARG